MGRFDHGPFDTPPYAGTLKQKLCGDHMESLSKGCRDLPPLKNSLALFLRTPDDPYMSVCIHTYIYIIIYTSILYIYAYLRLFIYALRVSDPWLLLSGPRHFRSGADVQGRMQSL